MIQILVYNCVKLGDFQIYLYVFINFKNVLKQLVFKCGNPAFVRLIPSGCMANCVGTAYRWSQITM